RHRQRRGWLWLCLELPLVFLLVPVLLTGHVALLIARLVRRARGQAPGVADRPQRHLFWVAADLFILAATVLGCFFHETGGRLRWDPGAGFNGWAGLLLGSVAFLAVSAGREAYKLLHPQTLPVAATDRRRALLLACGGVGLLLIGALWRPVAGALSPVLLLLVATGVLAWVRSHTQSLRWVLFRVGEAQRLR